MGAGCIWTRLYINVFWWLFFDVYHRIYTTIWNGGDGHLHGKKENVDGEKWRGRLNNIFSWWFVQIPGCSWMLFAQCRLECPLIKMLDKVRWDEPRDTIVDWMGMVWSYRRQTNLQFQAFLYHVMQCCYTQIWIHWICMWISSHQLQTVTA